MNALDYDIAHYSVHTIRTYVRHVKPYLDACTQSAQDPLNPNRAWFFGWLEHEARVSLAFARRQALAIRYYHTQRQKQSPVDDVHAVHILQYSHAARHPLPGKDCALAVPRYFSNRAYAPETLENYQRHTKNWEIFASEKGFDPVRPTAHQLAEFLSLWGAARAASTVRNARCALSHYFSRAKVPDVARDPDIDVLMDGIMRERPAQRIDPLFTEDLRKLIVLLGDSDPLDIRDRCMLLALPFGALTPRQFECLDKSRAEISDSGVLLHSTMPRRPEIFIGGIADPELDVRIWFAKWLEIVGREPGPLFPRFSPRGAWEPLSITPVAVYVMAKQLCRRAGVGYRRFTTRLRKGFLMRAGLHASPTAVARFAGFKSLDSLVPYVAIAGLHNPFSSFRKRRRSSETASRTRSTHSLSDSQAREALPQNAHQQ